MRLRALSVLLLAGALAPAGGAWGADLRFEQAAAMAAETNPELRAALDQLRASGYTVTSARSGYWPQLNANASASRPWGESVAATGYGTALAATQNLYAGGRDLASVEQAQANERAAAAALARVRAKVSYDLRAAFAAVQFAQQYLLRTEAISARRKENTDLVQLRYDTGRENQGSLKLAQAALSQARYERLEAGHALIGARAELVRVLGRPLTPATAVQGEVPLASPPAAIDAEQLALETPEVREADARMAAAGAQRGIARAGMLPSLSLSAQAARSDSEWAPRTDTSTVGAQLTVPLFSGGRDYYATRAATASADAAVAQRDAALAAAPPRLVGAYHNYVEAVEKLRVDGEFVAAASLRAEIARAKYNNGLLSFENWDLIENDLIARDKALLASRRQRAVAEAAWDQALGRSWLP